MKGKVKLGKVKFAVGILMAFMACMAAVSSASAAEFILQNTLDDSISVAVLYYDRATGLWTTRGWWDVDENSERTININNIDASKKVYYVGMVGNDLYYDKSTLNNDSVRRWISDDPFRFDSTNNEKPRGKNVKTVPFSQCRFSEGAGAYVIRLNTRSVG